MYHLMDYDVYLTTQIVTIIREQLNDTYTLYAILGL